MEQQTDLNQNGRKHGEEMKSVLFDKFISVTYRLAMLCKDNNGKAVIPGKLVDDAKELIGELEKELNIVQDSERAEAQEADRLREEVKELKKENERLSKKIIDLGTGTLAEKNYQLAIKQIQNPSKSFYQRYSGVSEEYAIGALEQCATEADELQARVKDLESKLTETIKLLSERSRECGKLEAEVRVLKAFVLKVHTSPVIFEDVNRALRDEAKTLWEKLNQSAESEIK